MTRSLRLARLIAMTDQLAMEVQNLHFSGLQARDFVWQPAVNIYASQDCIEVCMDLAGIQKDEISVKAEPSHVVVSGHRDAPKWPSGSGVYGRLLVMEIPDGFFERRLDFPVLVDVMKVRAWQENGWLWISLPTAGRES